MHIPKYYPDIKRLDSVDEKSNAVVVWEARIYETQVQDPNRSLTQPGIPDKEVEFVTGQLPYYGTKEGNKLIREKARVDAVAALAPILLKYKNLNS